MQATLGSALLAVAGPLVLFIAVGVAMMRFTGRSAFRQRRRLPESRPLNLRYRGYEAADWIENGVHLRQMRRYALRGKVKDRRIAVASLATQAKLLFFWVSALLMLALAQWMVVEVLAG